MLREPVGILAFHGRLSTAGNDDTRHTGRPGSLTDCVPHRCGGAGHARARGGCDFLRSDRPRLGAAVGRASRQRCQEPAEGRRVEHGGKVYTTARCQGLKDPRPSNETIRGPGRPDPSHQRRPPFGQSGNPSAHVGSGETRVGCHSSIRHWVHRGAASRGKS